MDRTYVVCQEWDYYDKHEKCVITYTSADIEDYDGYNMIGHKGFEGCSIDIYPTLEEAIIKSHFNPQAIDFQLDEKDLIEAKDIISRYDWSYEKGLIKKGDEDAIN